MFAFDVFTVHVREMASLEASKGLIFMALPQESQGLFESAGVKVYFTGVGKVKATYSAVKLIEKLNPEWILNLGTAGSKKIKIGQVVEATRFVQRDPLFAQFPQAALKTEALTGLPQVICGTADSVEYGVPSVACEIFDMEAYALAYVCEQLKVKFNSIKFISDSSDENVVDQWKSNLKTASEALLAQTQTLLNF